MRAPPDPRLSGRPDSTIFNVLSGKVRMPQSFLDDCVCQRHHHLLFHEPVSCERPITKIGQQLELVEALSYAQEISSWWMNCRPGVRCPSPLVCGMPWETPCVLHNLWKKTAGPTLAINESRPKGAAQSRPRGVWLRQHAILPRHFLDGMQTPTKVNSPFLD